MIDAIVNAVQDSETILSGTTAVKVFAACVLRQELLLTDMY
ncbi:hypothetical protein [Asticcacaulis endophyticus]|nr:hypothetical protein [Asticcacaulis endophyticus]